MFLYSWDLVRKFSTRLLCSLCCYEVILTLYHIHHINNIWNVFIRIFICLLRLNTTVTSETGNIESDTKHSVLSVKLLIEEQIHRIRTNLRQNAVAWQKTWLDNYNIYWIHSSTYKTAYKDEGKTHYAIPVYTTVFLKMNHWVWNK